MKKKKKKRLDNLLFNEGINKYSKKKKYVHICRFIIHITSEYSVFLSLIITCSVRRLQYFLLTLNQIIITYLYFTGRCCYK